MKTMVAATMVRWALQSWWPARPARRLTGHLS